MTFDELTRRYWRSRQRDFSPNTVADYTRTYARFAAALPADLAADVARITHEHVDDYLADLHDAGLGQKTIANHWTALSSLWTFAETKYDIPHCFRHKIACPRVKRDQPQPYTELEIKAMIRATAYNALLAHGNHSGTITMFAPIRPSARITGAARSSQLCAFSASWIASCACRTRVSRQSR